MIRLEGLERQVEEMVNRRPVAPEDLMDALGMGQKDAVAMLQRLSRRHGWLSSSHEGRVYFMISSRGNPEKQS
jgi:hypothetical protein